MSTVDEETRGTRPPAEVEIRIAAPVEEVWRALTDAEELARWFPLEARVEPGAGGSVWLSWGEGWSAGSRIEIWEPGRRLRAVSDRTDAGGRPVLLAVDYHLEPAEGGTVLRVVHSGFGRGAEWDQEYDAVSRGWKFELRSLRLYLERHRGTPRGVAWARVVTELTVDEVHRRVMGPEGLVAEGSLAGLEEGDPYRIAAATGEVFAGRVLINRPPGDFAGTVASLDDALLRYVYEVGTTSVWLSAWGVAEETVRDFERRWQAKLEGLLA